MGLMIHSLAELPSGATRKYFIYLLDYGWSEPIARALRENFGMMAELASKHDAVVIQGVPGSHFDTHVLSWHHVNGQDAAELLPGLLITNAPPGEFLPSSARAMIRHTPRDATAVADDPRLILIPVRKLCASPTDVVVLLDRIFADVKGGRELSEFRVAQEMRRGERGAFFDALVLEPNVAGVGVDLKRLGRFLWGKLKKQ